MLQKHTLHSDTSLVALCCNLDCMLLARNLERRGYAFFDDRDVTLGYNGMKQYGRDHDRICGLFIHDDGAF